MLREHIFSINLNNFQKRGGDRGGEGCSPVHICLAAVLEVSFSDISIRVFITYLLLLASVFSIVVY